LADIHGIDPGAGVLLRAEGPREVRTVLPKIDAIAALGIDPADAAPAYWRLLGERLAARHPLPDYTAARHAVWRSGRAAPGRRSGRGGAHRAHRPRGQALR